MKIAMMTDNFYPVVGGTENAVRELSDALTLLGHEVVVFAPKYRGEYNDEFNFKVVRCPAIKIDSGNSLACTRSAKQFKEQFRNFAPDVIHCQTEASMLKFAVKYGKKNNIPIVVTLHTKFNMSFYTATKSKILTTLLCKHFGRSVKKCDEVCSVSYSMRGEFNKLGYYGDFTVIKNGTPVSDVQDDVASLAREKYGLTSDDNLLIFVGRVEKVKNVDFIFEALKELNKSFKNFKMFFVGKICYKKFVKRVAKSEISDKVVFTGLITDKRLLQSLYQNAKLHLFPSIFDNDSLSVVESASCGAPSVVLENTGAAERITNERNGFTTEHSPDKFAEKIKDLLTNPKVLSEVASHARTELKKSWQTTAEEYVEIYRRLIKKLNKYPPA